VFSSFITVMTYAIDVADKDGKTERAHRPDLATLRLQGGGREGSRAAQLAWLRCDRDDRGAGQVSRGTWRMVDRQSLRHAPGVVPEEWREEAGGWWYAEDSDHHDDHDDR
jgi:hypothetical protein